MSLSSSHGRLLIDEPAPGVARLTISNPEKRGALDAGILEALATRLPELDARCVILTGEGRTFSAGYDIAGLPAGTLAGAAERLVDVPFAAALAAVADYPYPTIAAINGHAIGGGLELALCCDLRMAAEPATLGMPPAKLGLVYAPGGIRRFLDVIGAARTRELFLVGRRIDARTACTWGLVGSIVGAEELSEAAVALAGEVAANAPLAQRGNKRVIAAVLEARGALGPEVERDLAELRHAAFGSEDFAGAVRAFAEKRTPDWQGR